MFKVGIAFASQIVYYSHELNIYVLLFRVVEMQRICETTATPDTGSDRMEGANLERAIEQ